MQVTGSINLLAKGPRSLPNLEFHAQRFSVKLCNLTVEICVACLYDSCERTRVLVYRKKLFYCLNCLIHLHKRLNVIFDSNQTKWNRQLMLVMKPDSGNATKSQKSSFK